jgi:hypothetical protein
MNSPEVRKLQGKQFWMTLPAPWRQSHRVAKGSDLEIYYGDAGVLVVNPATRPLTELEKRLVKILVDIPTLKEMGVALTEVKEIISIIESKVAA